jgi:peptidoglycan hydrolase-like protein with peptidoglycan-binding domain
VEKLTTDKAGKIDRAIPVPAKGGKLRARGEEFLLAIGHLDPVEEESGLRARLANLGYYLAGGSDLDEEELRSAIEEFQVEHGLRVTGVSDAATRASIKKSHGS